MTIKMNFKSITCISKYTALSGCVCTASAGSIGRRRCVCTADAASLRRKRCVCAVDTSSLGRRRCVYAADTRSLGCKRRIPVCAASCFFTFWSSCHTDMPGNTKAVVLCICLISSA